jgi:pyruvate dehydrogenase E1 component alpha subunit
MEDGDVFASTHRAHAHTLARGTHPNELMAELYGKIEGCSHGYGGSMHLYDIERGNLGANAVVGGGLPAITGAALAFKLRGEPRVSSRSSATGDEHRHVPRVAQPRLAVEGAGGLRPREQPLGRVDAGRQQLPIEDIEKRAVAYGMHSMKVDGQDVEAVYKARSARSSYARSGKGRSSWSSRPTGSSGTSSATRRSTGRRGAAELRETQDPITKLREKLGLSDEEFEAMDAEALEIVEASVEFAKAGTDPKPEDALKNVYA